MISVTEAEQTFTFIDIAEQPLPSLLRGFSAPVKLSFPYNRDQLMFLMQHDSDGFNRWDAGQQLSVQVLQELIAQQQKGETLVLDQRLVSALRTVLSDETLDQAMVAEMLSLPGEAYLTEISEVADVDAIHIAREFARKQLAEGLFEGVVAALSGQSRSVEENPVCGRGRALRPSRVAEHCAVVPDAQRQAGSVGGDA